MWAVVPVLADTLDTTLLRTLGELGALGLMCFMLLRWLMTRIDQQLTNMIALMRATADRQTSALNANTMVIVGLQKQFLAHDLTVTGINPSTGDGDGERSELAIRKYTDCQATLDEILKAIHRLDASVSES